MKYIILLIFTFLTFYNLKSQGVVISSDTTASADPSAILDLNIANKGFLIPRVSLQSITDQSTIPNPAISLLVYNINNSLPDGTGFYYWNGTQWVKLLTQTAVAGWLLTGNTGTDPALNFVGTTDNKDLVFRTNNTERYRVKSDGNIGIGTSTPNASALVEFNTTNKGILFPRLSTTERNNINSPATNLTIYNTTHSRYEVNIGTPTTPIWEPIIDSTELQQRAWLLDGNTGTNPSNNFIGTKDNVNFSVRTNNNERIRVTNAGNIGINDTIPSQRLSVKGNVLLVPDGATASQLRFATPNDTSKYTAFRAQNQLRNQIVYTLPDTMGKQNAILSTDSTGKLFWQDMASLSSNLRANVTVLVTSPIYYATANDDHIIVTYPGPSNAIIYLPTPNNSLLGKKIFVKRNSSVQVFVNAGTGILIDDSQCYRLQNNYSSIMMVLGRNASDTNFQWYIQSTYLNVGPSACP